jgi:hypothetical protein
MVMWWSAGRSSGQAGRRLTPAVRRRSAGGRPAQRPAQRPTQRPAQRPPQRPAQRPPRSVPARSVPRSVPRSGPRSVPRSGPRSVPRSGPRSGPRSVPRSVPRSGPRSGPRSVPRSGPRSVPRSGPRSGPRSVPRSVPRSGRAPARFVDRHLGRADSFRRHRRQRTKRRRTPTMPSSIKPRRNTHPDKPIRRQPSPQPILDAVLATSWRSLLERDPVQDGWFCCHAASFGSRSCNGT